MFIRKRHVKARGKTYVYYSIVETTRESGKPRQKMLYNMGTHSTIEQCIAAEQKWLDHWMRQDQAAMTAQLSGYARMLGMRIDPEHVAKRRAHYQAQIDFLNDALSRVSRRREN